jgi:hypothetical protein
MQRMTKSGEMGEKGKKYRKIEICQERGQYF